MNDLRKKLGQLFMISFEGVVAPKEAVSLIREHNIGAVLLFASNCPTIHRTHELVCELKSCAKNEPLCVGLDHEGGKVHRLPKPVTHFPPMRTVGELYRRLPSTNIGLELGRVMGSELKALGVDLDFAPVMDVDTNAINPVIGDRSFGNQAEIVSAAGAHLIQGLQEKKVAACAKHFPGHGDTNEDSHKNLPRLPHNNKRLHSLELVPFAAAIRQKVAAIMPAHVVYEGVDKSVPATFSVKILRDLLRTEMNFEGVIISDSLDMGAVTSLGSLEEISLKAFLAGCDWLIVGREPEKIPAVLDAFVNAVEKGVLAVEKIEASYQRILRLKSEFCGGGAGEARPSLEIIGSAGHKEILNKIKELD